MAFAQKYPLEGYRRLAFMMLDADVVAVSPSSVYRVLKGAGLLQSLWQKPSRKGTGFVQPLHPHEHWHINFSYVNIGGTFYYLCSILDGASRFIVQWDTGHLLRAGVWTRPASQPVLLIGLMFFSLAIHHVLAFHNPLIANPGFSSLPDGNDTDSRQGYAVTFILDGRLGAWPANSASTTQ